jgi:hypothetical protein
MEPVRDVGLACAVGVFITYLDFVKITAENGCKSSYNKAKSIYNQ